jgi:hypothetical protein
MCFRRYYLAGLSGLMACLLSVAALADNLVRPDPSIAPAEVVAIQLMSLKNNDLVEADFGIRQTWNFAHPQNRKVTGPFPRFAMMLKGPGYDVLLNHKSHSITTGSNTASGKTSDGAMWRQFDVLMETRRGEILYFSWVVQKVTSGQFKDCWLTVAVSSPRPAGQSG